MKIEKVASEDNLRGKILRFFGIDFLNNVILKGDSDKNQIIEMENYKIMYCKQAKILSIFVLITTFISQCQQTYALITSDSAF